MPRNIMTNTDNYIMATTDSCHAAEITAKYMDDACKAVAVSLQHCLEPTEYNERPVSYHQRTGHRLKSSHNVLQDCLYDFTDFAHRNEFSVNIKKSSLMLFNVSKNFDFPPELKLSENGETLNVVESTKILALFVHISLNWDTHIEYVCSKAKSRIWILRRLMELGLDYTVILDVYFKEIRTVLEYGAVLFHSSLTRKQSRAIEAVHRSVMKLLSRYLELDLTPSEANIFFCAEDLFSRREDLCTTFLKRNIDNPLFRDIFVKSTQKYVENFARTSRNYKNPVNFLRRLANKVL